MFHAGPTYVVTSFLWKSALFLGLVALIMGGQAAATVGKTGADVIGQGVGVTAASLKQAGDSFTAGKAAGDAARPVGPLLGGSGSGAAGQTQAKPKAKKVVLGSPVVTFNLPPAAFGSN